MMFGTYLWFRVLALFTCSIRFIFLDVPSLWWRLWINCSIELGSRVYDAGFRVEGLRFIGFQS